MTPKQRFVEKFCQEYKLSAEEFDAAYSTVPGKVRLDTGKVVQWQIVRCADLRQLVTVRIAECNALPGVRLLGYNVWCEPDTDVRVWCDVHNWPYSAEPEDGVDRFAYLTPRSRCSGCGYSFRDDAVEEGTALIEGCPGCHRGLLDVNRYFQPGSLADIAGASKKEKTMTAKSSQMKPSPSTWITPDGQCAGCACELKGATISLRGMRYPGCGSTFASKAEVSETPESSPNRLFTKEEQKLQEQVQHELVQKLGSEISHWLETWARCNGITTSTEQCLRGLTLAVLRHCQAAVIKAGDLGVIGPVDSRLLHALGNPKLPPGLTETSEKLQHLKYGE